MHSHGKRRNNSLFCKSLTMKSRLTLSSQQSCLLCFKSWDYMSVPTYLANENVLKQIVDWYLKFCLSFLHVSKFQMNMFNKIWNSCSPFKLIKILNWKKCPFCNLSFFFSFLGKTYVGLKIVQALLRNESVWQISAQKFPILVVCYTNHALDQFLEGNKCLHAKLFSTGAGDTAWWSSTSWCITRPWAPS